MGVHQKFMSLTVSLPDREDASGRQMRREHAGLQRGDGRRSRRKGQGGRHPQIPQGEQEFDSTRIRI